MTRARRSVHNVDPAIAEVWAQRAAALASVPASEDEVEHTELVVVRCADEAYAFDARYVFDIRPVEMIARVPRVPAWIAGLTSIRGRILSVLDLAAYFHLPGGESAQREDQHLVLVETPDMELCLLVDQVVAVVPLAMDSLTAPGESLQGLPPEYVRGLALQSDARAASWDGGCLVVLDLPALLADKRIIVNQEPV